MSFDFEKLIAYQKSLEVVDGLYILAGQFPAYEQTGLARQLRRAAVSITLNIAEGSGRTYKDFQRFLDLSRTSAYECVACITIAKRRGYINQMDFDHHYSAIEEVVRITNGLKNSLDR